MLKVKQLRKRHTKTDIIRQIISEYGLSTSKKCKTNFTKEQLLELALLLKRLKND